MNNKLVFIHIPKCGGASVYNALRTCLNNIVNTSLGVGIFNSDNIKTKINPSLLNIPVDLLMGHFGMGYRHTDIDDNYIIVFRDPIKRMSSYYNHIKHKPTPKKPIQHKVVKDNTLSNLLENPEIMNDCIDLKLELDNPFVRYLTGNNGRINQKKNITVDDFNEAKKVLLKDNVEFFKSVTDKQLILTLNQYYPELGLKVLPKTNTSKTDHISKLSKTCTDLMKKPLEYDLKLYKFITEQEA